MIYLFIHSTQSICTTEFHKVWVRKAFSENLLYEYEFIIKYVFNQTLKIILIIFYELIVINDISFHICTGKNFLLNYKHVFYKKSYFEMQILTAYQNKFEEIDCYYNWYKQRSASSSPLQI